MDSSFRRVPAVIDPKQAVFIDGIRHAIDIIEIAYIRLRNLLTDLALNLPDESQLITFTPYAFLDAWAIVDAVDKFRMLYQGFPGMTSNQPKEGEKTLAEACENLRKMRNIADHPTGSAELVVSKGGDAFGTLTWITGHKVDPVEVWFCTLRPGTLRGKPKMKWDSITTTLNWPTDRICLSVGGHEANLSAILHHIEKRVKHLEVQLDIQFQEDHIKNSVVINDVFIRQAYIPAPNQFLWQEPES